ncbi:MAG: DUF4124 domain-containing protein [Azoarcus sp.]|nr:DUF4124 domain-containing protein [Azoarcus sp.]
MMHKFLAILLALAAISPAAAQVYKCVENGKTVFVDRPCHKDAAPLDVRPAAGAYDAAAAARIRQQTDSIKTEAAREDRARETNREITRAQSERDELKRQCDRRLADLNRDRDRANNNLAGAVYHRGVTSQINSVTEECHRGLLAHEQRIQMLEAGK